MVQQATAAKPKTSNISHKSLPVCACRKLAGFAEFAQICGTTPTRNRDANGNRTSKTTPWGTVAYSYDAENRMTESGDLGKSESVKYTYDKNGNLLSEVAARYRKDYVYNAQNRMIFSDVQDAFLNTRNLTEYRYDAFGRRIETIEYLGDSTRNLYDGFSFDVVGKTLLQTRSAPAMTEQKYRAGSAGHPELGSGSASAGRSGAGVANGTRYRYIGDEPLEQAGSAGAGNNGANASSSANGAKTRSRPNSEYVLYSNGEPVAVNSDNGVSYFGTDILGSVRSVTDRNGQVKASYEYDAFGTPYLSNLENDVGFGYCGKVYDSATGLYDYGFRDYSPNSARFTTVDPVRDGANWFSYCMNDAVNYVDLFGLNPISDLVDDFVDGAKELAGKAKDEASNLINDIKSAGKEAVGILKDNYIDLFDSAFLNTSSHILIAIPEHPNDFEDPNLLVIKPNEQYKMPFDAIYDPVTGIMYKASDGQSVAVAENIFGEPVFIEKYTELNIPGTMASFVRGNSFPGKYESPLPKDLQDFLNIPIVSDAINIVNSNGNKIFSNSLENHNSVNSNYSNIGSSTNFSISGIYGDTSIIQNLTNSSASNKLANFAINSLTLGLRIGGCTK